MDDFETETEDISRSASAGDVQRILDALANDQAEQQRYKDYYYGDQQVRFATEKFKTAFGRFFTGFSDNLCPAVVDSLVDRLTVTGFDKDEGKQNLDTDTLWRNNRMKLVASKVHREALVTGCAYVLVWPNSKGVPTVYPQRTGLCAAIRSEDDPYLLEVSGKLWKSWDLLLKKYILRLNLYYSDRTERYFKENSDTSNISEKQFLPYARDTKPQILPNPYDLNPMFVFENSGLPGEPGYSTLLPVIPLQDALNKSILDTMVAMEYYGLPQRYATGIEIQYDEIGNAVEPFIPGEDRLWFAASTDVKFGEFAQADVEKLLLVAEHLRTEIARVSGTPLHYFLVTKGDFPSGEALKTAEARFIAKIENLQDEFGEVWETLMRLLLIQDNQEITDEDMLECTWTDASPVTDEALVKLLTAKQSLGVSDRQLLLECGYTDEQIDGFERDNLQKQSDAMTSAQNAFNAGVPVDAQGNQAPLPFPSAQ